jgi:NAD(P)-dependent dehydrogenase (short-subunit alcohol dehydrogenase family)
MRFWGPLGLAVATTAIVALVSLPGSAVAADLDCADFSSQAEAQENLLPGDPHGLDGDSDGIACEDNPCPCSSGGPSESAPPQSAPSPPKPPPYRLSKSAARHAAEQLARHFANRNPQVDSLSFGGCRQPAARSVKCNFTARGVSSSSRTTCHLRVAVRARDRHPVARFVSTQCQTRSTLILTRERARRALSGPTEEKAGKRVGLELTRLNRLEFEGWAEWNRPGAAAGSLESCSLETLAELVPPDTLRVQVAEPVCEAL